MLNEINFLDRNLLALLDERFSNEPSKSSRNIFLHNLRNIMEDEIIRRWSPKMGNDLYDYFIGAFLRPQIQNYVDDGGPNSFLQYLRFCLLCKKMKINVTCAAYENHKKELTPRINKVLLAVDPTNFSCELSTLGEWIIDNIYEIKWKKSKKHVEEAA